MRTKLTMITICANGHRHARFLQLPVDACNRATLPESKLNEILDELRVRRDDIYNVR